MKKNVLIMIVVQLFCSFFLSRATELFAAEAAKPQVSSEKSVTGLIKIIVPIPLKKAFLPSPGSEPETSSIKTDVKGYRLSLENLSDRYEIILHPATAVKAGNVTLLPDELRKGHFITAIYSEAGDKTEILSVVLNKVKAERGIKFWSLLIGLFLTIVLLLLLNNVLRKNTHVKGGLFIGFDKRYSNSKVQMVIWTFLVIFSYVTLYFERYFASIMTSISYSSLISIPENLAILMGISASSFVGAKLITASKVGSGSISKTASNTGPAFADLITNDYKAIDLGDAQMFAWTLVASVIYLSLFLRMWWYLDPAVEVSLPDIDSTLLVLTGMSQAAYAGKKLVTSDAKPTISGIEPAAGAKADETITITGSAFGNQPGGIILGTEGIKTVAWYDTIILAKIAPNTQGAVIPQGKTVLCLNTAYSQRATTSYTIL